MPQEPPLLPDFTRWPSFPFEGDMRVKNLAEPVEVEPPRNGDDAADCVACKTPDDAYIWVSERWRVRGMDRPTGLPVVLILECRSHLDIGDLPSLLAAELGVMTVRLERAIRSLDGVARVHVNRWGDGSAHLHMWFLARPYGRLQLRGTFLSLWDDILPAIPEEQWLENLALVAEWLAGFGGQAIAEPAHIHWQSPSTFSDEPARPADPVDAESDRAAPGSVHTAEHPAADAVIPSPSRGEGINPPRADPDGNGQTTAGQNLDSGAASVPLEDVTPTTGDLGSGPPKDAAPGDASPGAPGSAADPEGHAIDQPGERSETTPKAATDS